MTANIFYPTFTLTITILACFIRKKAKLFRGFAPTGSPRHRPGPPRPPSFNRFWFCQELMRPYFFCIIPCLSPTSHIPCMSMYNTCSQAVCPFMLLSWPAASLKVIFHTTCFAYSFLPVSFEILR